ncbi:MAG: hypothetical protein H6977_13680 [Gammaproteobacteria bacterium]|nr:hypothetical protein [Gammaproteobacteria bacterium]MCP5201061.1 hypothetical protein [Gammaproteobacteria bacterium]
MSLVEILGYLGSFISSLAVVVSLIYVAQEMKRSNRLARLSAIDALRDATNRFREVLLEGDNLAVWLKGMREPDAMTEEERYRWDELGLYLWDSTQATYLRAIELEEPFTVRRIGYSVRYASTGPGFARWWEPRRGRFHPDFVAFVDTHLGQPIDDLGPLDKRKIPRV